MIKKAAAPSRSVRPVESDSQETPELQIHFLAGSQQGSCKEAKT